MLHFEPEFEKERYADIGDHFHRLVEVTLGEKITSLPNSITFAVERLIEAAAVLELEDPSMLAFKSAINYVSEDNLQLRSILIYLTGLEQDLIRSTEELKQDLDFIQSYIATENQAMLDKSALEKDKRAIVVKAQEYQEELKTLSARVRTKEKDVKALEIRLEAFHGLPPNLDLARNQLRVAREEHLKLLNARDMLLEKMNVGLQ
ncbi:hypothetical protein Clacol_008088 [Clathrus columnatus]|uniref:HAUS augmin-like complex subunit 1 n=1 Tax=Clathrus columnatus TaxID=1419009 RepID=A0AAV5AGR7_9AGAM|nr:hypothetical protein Clacol_008088 [Clathrus columnatus]